MVKPAVIFLMLCLLLTPVLFAQKLQIGESFPEITGELLSYKKITIPEHCKGKVSILIVAFKRGTQPQIDSWTTPLMQEFSNNSDFRFLEIPMISNFYSWISGYIDNGMRGGIVESMHKNVMTYYGPLDTYFTYFGVEDKKLCYLFLLDREGKIQFLANGESSSEQLAILFQKVKILLNS